MNFYGEKLREIRIRKGLSQEKLANAVSVAKSAISQYECNKRTPDFTIAGKICKVLKCELTEIADAPELETFLGDNSFDNNATYYVNESHVTYGAVQSECMRLIDALFGDSPEALTYIKSLKISQSGKIEGLENIDVTSKALLDGARTTWIAALRNALEKGTDRVQIPV